MSTSGPRPSPSNGPGSFARVLAVPVAVLLAGLACVAMVVALANAPLPSVRLVVGEEEPGSGTARGPSQEPSPAPGTGPGEEPTTEEGGPAPQSVPPESYNGASAMFDAFLVEVEAAYTDTTITDGRGTSDTAPAGMEFHIYRLNVTNQGTEPAVFDTYGTIGTTTDGLEYANDVDAEIVVAWDYFWEDVNPEESVTTHIMFLVPDETEFAEVRIAGHTLLEPR